MNLNKSHFKNNQKCLGEPAVICFLVAVPSNPVPHSFLSNELMGNMEHTVAHHFSFSESFEILHDASGQIFLNFF